MSEFLMSGGGLFPGWVSILFSVGLALGIIHHLPCLVFGHGSRWFHAGHAAMALSMIYMFLSMSYNWNWLPASWQMWFFVGTTAAVSGYLVTEVIRKRPVNFLWILLLVQQAAMIYMWYPMMSWNVVIIFALVSWFAIETFGWAANLFPDDVRIKENRSWFPYLIGSSTATAVPARREPAIVGSAASRAVSCGCDEDTAPGQLDCHTTGFLITSHWKDRVLMAIMALSMGYMFYGMQVM